MSATSIVKGVLKVFVEGKWVDAVKHMNGAINKAAILAKEENGMTDFPELGFSIIPRQNKEENSNKKQHTKVTNPPLDNESYPAQR